MIKYIKLPSQLKMHLELKNVGSHVYRCKDGGNLCHKCVVGNLDLICLMIEDSNENTLNKIIDRAIDQWAVWSIVSPDEYYNLEELQCDNCYKPLI